MNVTELPLQTSSPRTSDEKLPFSDPGSKEKEENDAQAIDESDASPKYITGWRLHVITIGYAFSFRHNYKSILKVPFRLSLSMFLPNFEVSIVSTSLLTITNELKGFNHSSWVVDAYLITYTGRIFRLG